MTPLFIPLRRVWFEAFERGEKDEEWRRLGPQWNADRCVPGRPVILALGYGGRQLRGHVVAFSVRAASGPAAEIYGEGTACAVITIEIERS